MVDLEDLVTGHGSRTEDFARRLVNLSLQDQDAVLEKLETICRRAKPIAIAGILESLFYLKPIGTSPRRLAFVAELLRHEHETIREDAMDLAVTWGQRSDDDARHFLVLVTLWTWEMDATIGAARRAIGDWTERLGD